MKKKITFISVCRKILGIFFYLLAFIFGIASYLLKTHVQVSKNTEEDTSSEALFRELCTRNPSLRDPRPPKDW